MTKRKTKTKTSQSYAKHDTRSGFVPEQDGHFTVNYLPIVEGWTAHAVKQPPKLSPEQWVEVIHRNGETHRGPVETFAWRLFRAHWDDREDYRRLRYWGWDHIEHKPAFDHIGMEITHYRTIPTPPDDWVQGMPWPFNDGADAGETAKAIAAAILRGEEIEDEIAA